MKRPAIPSAVLLDRLASDVFGRDWAARVAELTGHGRRQVARVMAAGRAGRDHPAASEIGAALWSALSVIVKRDRALAGHWRRMVEVDRPAALRGAARVREAYLALHRAALPAPVDGYVAKRTVQLGQRVAAGAPVLFHPLFARARRIGALSPERVTQVRASASVSRTIMCTRRP